MSVQTERAVDYRFKFLYAIGMIIVVCCHSDGGGLNLFYDWFSPYAYVLALFVFCSGYFYRDGSETDLGAYLLRKVKRLLVPLYLWNCFYALLVLVLRPLGFSIGLAPSFRTLVLMPLYEGSQFEYNLGSWFVAPLFFLELFNVLFRRVFRVAGSRRRELAAFAAYLLLGVLGIYLARSGFRRGWEQTLVRSLYFLPFYGLGLLYRRVLERYDTLPHAVYFAVVLLLQYVLIIVVGHVPAYTISLCDNFNDGLLTPFITGALGIAFWLRVARLVESTLARDKCFNAIADNTFSIMTNHFLGFMLVKAGFAFLKRTTSHCQAFDMELFRSDLVYFYLPGGKLFTLFYVAAGLAVPILMQKLVDRVKRLLFTRPTT
ncbi:MAG: acyltransferase family protein [Oscillospiraceae bacterium]|nr:acyltransferase family protein [Oscillospiraceae bacterium]